MKTTNNLGIKLAVLASAAMIAAACGGKSGGGDGSPDEPQEELAPVEEPRVKPKKKVSGALNVGTLKLVETNIDLVGDFRIKKVEQDAAGYHYVALVSDVKATEESDPVPGYAIIKFDSKGQEVWRFPTLENAAVTTVSDETIGAYLLGALADMHVTPAGDVFLVGIRAKELSLKESDSIANFKAGGWQLMDLTFTGEGTPRQDNFGNLAFLSRIRGAGLEKDSPKFESYATLAAPLWWTPHAIWMDESGAITLESSSGGTSDGVVQQVQRIDADFATVRESACFVSRGVNGSVGDQRLLNIAVTAPESLVNLMTAALTAKFEEKDIAEVSNYLSTSFTKLRGEQGRCWDLIGSRVMPSDDEAFRIKRPDALAAGEAMSSKVESLEDLLLGKKSFEEYEITNSAIVGSRSWTPDVFGPQYQTLEVGHARWFALGDEMIHVGLGGADILGKNELLIGNARIVEKKSWQVSLETSSQRHPASIDMAVIGKNVVTAWTDVHRPGETNAENRALRIAQIPTKQLDGDSLTVHEFEVPASTGHASFSSVRLASGKGNSLAVFATVGTREGEASAVAKMKQATLLIGFTK